MRITHIEAKIAADSGRDMWEEYRRSTEFRDRFDGLCERFDALSVIADSHPGLHLMNLADSSILSGFKPMSFVEREHLRMLDRSLYPPEDSGDGIPSYSVTVAKSHNNDALEVGTYLTYAFDLDDGRLDCGIATSAESYYTFWERIRLPGATALLFTIEGEPKAGTVIPVEAPDFITYNTLDEQFEGISAALDILENTPRELPGELR